MLFKALKLRVQIYNIVSSWKQKSAEKRFKVKLKRSHVNQILLLNPEKELPKTRKSVKSSLCCKTLCNKQSLSFHLRTHTGEKPYRDYECGKRFALKKTLNEHIKSAHTGEKPHQCTQCDNTFARRSNLTRHIRTHTGENAHSVERDLHRRKI